MKKEETTYANSFFPFILSHSKTQTNEEYKKILMIYCFEKAYFFYFSLLITVIVFWFLLGWETRFFHMIIW